MAIRRLTLTACIAFAACLAHGAFAESIRLNEIRIKGTTERDEQALRLKFNLVVGNDSLKYEVQETATPVRGYLYDSLDFSGVRVFKRALVEGLWRSEELANRGMLDLHTRKRTVQNMVLGAVKIEGSALAGLVDDGLWLKGLTVSDTPSDGGLDYNSANGHYNANAQCRFGRNQIKGMGGSACAIDFDDNINQDIFHVKMQFGEFDVTGTILFSASGDKTLADHNLIVQRTDKQPLELGLPNSGEQRDDVRLMELTAFFQLLAYDLYAD